MRHVSILILLATAVAAAGCASSTNTVPQTVPAAPATQVAAATERTSSADPDEKICKVTRVTGTRIRKQKICFTAREWNALADASQKAMRDVERSNSAGVGGESLPTDTGRGN